MEKEYERQPVFVPPSITRSMSTNVNIYVYSGFTHKHVHPTLFVYCHFRTNSPSNKQQQGIILSNKPFIHISPVKPKNSINHTL